MYLFYSYKKYLCLVLILLLHSDCVVTDCVVTDHVDLDSLWMAPWDAGGTLGDSCRPTVATWRTVFRSVV